MTGVQNPTPYSDSFFEEIEVGAFRSAQIIVPLVWELIRPRSVIDVGCGRGTWLSAFQKQGVESILGLDGDYVSREKLAIPVECFRAVNLAESFDVGHYFDLAMSLEVAEHLSARTAAAFVKSLTQAAPVVLFSAAIPGQGGTNHVNEDWPWIWEALFKERGFLRLDPIQRHIRDDRRVEWWYRQNICLYTTRERIQEDVRLQAELKYAEEHPVEWVQLEILLRALQPRPRWQQLRSLLRYFLPSH